MTKFQDILDMIIAYEGGMITLILDSEPINHDFLFCIKEKLKNDYKIIETQDREELTKEREEKTIIIHKYNKDFKYNSVYISWHYTHNKNIILIILRKHYETTNTSLSQQAGQLAYMASLILLLKSKKIKILKQRFTEIKEIIDLQKLNLNNILRKVKIKTLNEK